MGAPSRYRLILGLILLVISSFNQRDIETVMALYEPQPLIVAQPGQIAEKQAALGRSPEPVFE